jgi:hypothetical protein
MSNTAFELIRVIELERSGIRDGDGCWSGSDPLGGTMNDLRELLRQLDERDRNDMPVPTDLIDEDIHF